MVPLPEMLGQELAGGAGAPAAGADEAAGGGVLGLARGDTRVWLQRTEQDGGSERRVVCNHLRLVWDGEETGGSAAGLGV